MNIVSFIVTVCFTHTLIVLTDPQTQLLKRSAIITLAIGIGILISFFNTQIGRECLSQKINYMKMNDEEPELLPFVYGLLALIGWMIMMGTCIYPPPEIPSIKRDVYVIFMTTCISTVLFFRSTLGKNCWKHAIELWDWTVFKYLICCILWFSAVSLQSHYLFPDTN